MECGDQVLDLLSLHVGHTFGTVISSASKRGLTYGRQRNGLIFGHQRFEGLIDGLLKVFNKSLFTSVWVLKEEQNSIKILDALIH